MLGFSGGGVIVIFEGVIPQKIGAVNFSLLRFSFYIVQDGEHEVGGYVHTDPLAVTLRCLHFFLLAAEGDHGFFLHAGNCSR